MNVWPALNLIAGSFCLYTIVKHPIKFPWPDMILWTFMAINYGIAIAAILFGWAP